MRKSQPFLILTFLLGFLLSMMVAGPSRASQIELSANQIYSTWGNINDALIVIAASTAIDDEWTEEFKAIAEEPVTGKSLADVNDQMDQFRAKLNAVLSENEFDLYENVSIHKRAADSPPVLFLNTGNMMDRLILLLIQIDPLAFVAQYYAWDQEAAKTSNDVFSVVALANRRMDEYMEENGIEMPEEDSSESGGS